MNKYLVLLAVLVAGNAQAWNCKHQRDLDLTLDLDASELLSIIAGAGDLEITGRSGTTEARIGGTVCVSEPEWLDQVEIYTEGGTNAEIAVSLPDVDGGWSISGNRYAYVDLRIEVPDTLPLDVRDSSGDMSIESTAGVTVSDSSGDIEIEDVKGNVVLNDSSGDIDLMDIAGDVRVRQDSSGDIYGRDILGSVVVERDSSGDIRFQDVRDDFVVERDSSGDIAARSVGGDFRVLRDGSGGIRVNGVAGEVDIPRGKE
jgi:hypothetical protein